MTRLARLRDVRTRLLVIVLAALTAALAATTYGFNALFERTTSRDATALLRAQADSELGLLDVHGRTFSLVERSDDAIGDARVWIFRDGRAIERPRASPSTAAAVASVARRAPTTLDVPRADERLMAVPIVAGGRRAGTLVTGISLAPYEETRRTALIGSLAFALTLLALVGIAVWWLLRSALAPVARMTQQAAAWSEHDLDHRFDLGEPHDELTRLGATLDALLDRLAASLRHERRFSAEVSHELRTPLAKLIAETELALRRARSGGEYRRTLETVLDTGHQIARIVEALVAAARDAAGPRGIADAASVAHAVADAVEHSARSHGVSVEVRDPARALRVGVDPDLAERILHPVVENACRYGRSAVRVELARDGAGVVFSVRDDGPGVEPGEEERIFQPAVRGSAGATAGGGAGLGLALARRLARSAAGDVEVDGDAFVVRLPAV